jgi:hypothetical protein
VVTAWFDLRRDWVALTILALSIVMIGSGLTGHSRVFGYAVVLFIGVLAGLGFQAGTAFVVYGIWLPAFFTLGVTYVLVFDRLSDQSAVAADEKAAP